MATTMATPLTNIPLKTQHSGDNNELQDPMVQDVLKEFEEEIAASKKNTQQQQQVTQQMHQQQMLQQQQQMMQQQQQQYQQNQSLNNYQQQFNFFPKKNLIDYNLARKALIITIIVLLLNYTQIFSLIYEKLPPNLNSISIAYDFYIKGSILFIALYILFLYDII
jgi:hypothetical protein